MFDSSIYIIPRTIAFEQRCVYKADRVLKETNKNIINFEILLLFNQLVVLFV